jgi:hypothetical protein
VATLGYDPAIRTGVWTFAPAALPDGDYRATLPAGSVLDPGGGGLTAGFTADFFVLAGDATRDRAVNFDHLLVLAKNYNRTGATWAQGDFTGDGLMNSNDLLILAKNYNKRVPATGAAPASAAAMDVQALAAAMGIGVPTPVPAKKPVVSPKPAPKPTPVVRAVAPALVAAKAPPASVLRDDAKAKAVFSTTRVAKPVPGKPKVVAKANGR